MAVQIISTISFVFALPNRQFLKIKTAEVSLTDYTDYTFTSFLIIGNRKDTAPSKNDPNFACPQLNKEKSLSSPLNKLKCSTFHPV